MNHNKSLFFEKNGYYPKVSLAVGISIDITIETAKKNYLDTLRDEKVNPAEAWSMMPVTVSSLYERLQEYQYLYGIDEFILLDMESDNEKRIENIEAISSMFNLNKELVSEVKENI